MNDDVAEVALGGGNLSTVVRVGDTVRRSVGPWTPAVHVLLEHLEWAGFDAAPRALGYDDKGREVLSFIDGDAGVYPMPDDVWTDETLVEATRLLRRLHDLTASFESPEDAVWRQHVDDPGPREVMCHSDWGPYNAIFRAGRLVAMVDWDFARPGSRVWDLAHFAHCWCPLSEPAWFLGNAPIDATEQGRRLRLLCDSYGVDDRGAVLDAIFDRIERTPGWLRAQAEAGDPSFQRMVADGGPDHYGRVLVYLRAARDELMAALG